MIVPPEILLELERSTDDLVFGKVTFEITFHDAKPRFRITREVSFIPGRPNSGSGGTP